ncbi:MAG TPA: hypothetical protein VFW62_03600, partial [bacterium]|nr:hypothetical protein [bacterium]
MPNKYLSLFPAMFVVALGCAGPGKQVAQIQSEKQELISAIEAEKKAKEALEQKAASLEARLDQSEKETARLSGRQGGWDDGIRSASSKNSALPLGEGRGAGGTSPSEDHKKPAEDALPWKKSGASSPDPAKKSAPMSLQAPAESEERRLNSKVGPSLRSIAER